MDQQHSSPHEQRYEEESEPKPMHVSQVCLLPEVLRQWLLPKYPKSSDKGA